MSRERPVFRNRAGVALAFAVVALVALLGIAALAVDVGMLFTARGETQRVADAAALAGASAFLEYLPTDPEARRTAEDRAYDYALRNTVRDVDVDSSEVAVEVVTDSAKVRVAIRRLAVQPWFSRMIGIDSVDVGAVAAAVADGASAARCLKPFALPDLWYNAADDNQIWDSGETWDYDSSDGDYYRRYGDDSSGGGEETGFVSTFRNGIHDHAGNQYDHDFGRPVEIKISDPTQTEPASVFRPWVIPEAERQGECRWEIEGNASPTGAAQYRANICQCNTAEIELDTEYDIETGNMAGPTYQGVQELIDQDPDAYWDESREVVAGSIADNWRNSPRVVTIALYDPSLIEQPGKQTISFNNFALVFLEGQQSPQHPVRSRFLYFASGTGTGNGSTQGTTAKFLRLVE